MATTQKYIEYVCEQISGIGDIRYRKMFGEYMIYINNKPVIIVCNSIPYVKELDEIKSLMVNAEKGPPYKGAKEHYILDIDDADFSKKVVLELEKVIPFPKKKK
jgi:TfoX/Sxy family transcriptional regulator of competence genes